MRRKWHVGESIERVLREPTGHYRSNKSIAKLLGCHASTVERHRLRLELSGAIPQDEYRVAENGLLYQIPSRKTEALSE